MKDATPSRESKCSQSALHFEVVKIERDSTVTQFR